jgi:hypothetical protein
MKILISLLLLSLSISKSLLHKSQSKHSMKSKLRFGNKLKTKDDVWSPTGIKDGNPKNKTGDDWCTSEEDGPSMLSCVKLWDPSALRVYFFNLFFGKGF